MSIDITTMSAEAQKLVELTKGGAYGELGDKGFSGLDVSKVLRDHPELMAGLNEYMAWRDDMNKAIGETKQLVPIAHSAQKALRDLRKQPKKVKGK